MTKDQKIYRILAALKKRQMTRQEISRVTGIPLESVCGRVNELIHYGKVETCGHQLYRPTKKYRAILRIKKTQELAA